MDSAVKVLNQKVNIFVECFTRMFKLSTSLNISSIQKFPNAFAEIDVRGLFSHRYSPRDKYTKNNAPLPGIEPGSPA